MSLVKDETGQIASLYIASFSLTAKARIGDDINRAIGLRRWAEAHRLQRAQLRIRRREYCAQIVAQRKARTRLDP